MSIFSKSSKKRAQVDGAITNMSKRATIIQFQRTIRIIIIHVCVLLHFAIIK